MTSPAAKETTLLLTGIDGSNPLGFLAALGALRTLQGAQAGEAVTLTWVPASGAWRPALGGGAAGGWDRAELLALLEDHLRTVPDPRAFTLCADREAGPDRWADKLRLPPDDYRLFARAARDSARPGDRDAADFAAAWACESCAVRDSVEDTRFQFTAGQQRFLDMVRELVRETRRDDLERTLFEPWEYRDPGPSLRWDPADEARQYALQWYDPTNDTRNPITTMRGANRLAIEALPLLPSFPTRGGLRTTGFSRFGRRPAWTWPLWTGPVGLDVVRSLLCHPALQEERPDRAALGPLGVVEIFRSFVVKPSGRYRNFTPGQAV